VGAPPTAACPGSATAPAAAANNLCVYASNQSGATGMAIGPNRFGANMFPTGVAADTDYELIGTWAVSAAAGASSSAPTRATSQSSR
jgi:hypothetical protein